MSGYTFVVSDRLIVDQRAIGEVGGGNDDATGALAVRRAGNVVSCGGRLKGWYGFDGHRRLGNYREKLREFWLHLGDVVAEIVDDLVGGGRNVFAIGLEGAAEGREIVEAFFFRDKSHLILDTSHLAETELVYLVRRQAGGGPAINVIFVALLAIWQRGDRKSSTALGGVFGSEEGGEGLVGGNHVDVDGV